MNKNGLINYGFNCFINTTIQCLKSCNSIKKELKENTSHDKEILLQLKKYIDLKQSSEINQSQDKEEVKISLQNETTKVIDDKLFSYLKVYFNFKMLINNLSNDDNQTHNPRDLIIACKQASNFNFMEHLFNGSQNDMQEFLIFLLDVMNESISYKKDITVPDTKPTNVMDVISKKSIEVYKNHYENNYSWFVRDFYFLILNVIKCNACEHNNLAFEPSNILCLPIPKEDNITIYDCLDHYFGKDVFDDKNKWTCDKCGNGEKNYKESRLINSPETLIIVIKRFQYNGNGWSKLKENIEFPHILDISAYIVGKKKENGTYKLKSVGNHQGNLGSGHYFAYCLEDDEWYNYNDESISKINSDKIVSNSAYTLFYEKINL